MIFLWLCEMSSASIVACQKKQVRRNRGAENGNKYLKKNFVEMNSWDKSTFHNFHPIFMHQERNYNIQ
jgi:hypothetical protein